MDLLKLLFGPPIPTVTPEEAQAKLKGKPAPFILDVRQPEEYAEVRLAGAKLIPLSELGGRLKELPKDRAILCVCRSGNRSSSAARQLLAAGYTVINLKGGLLGWQAAQLPVKTGK